MADRFFLETPAENRQAILGGDQAHHLSRVMRAQPGDKVTLFDGVGTEHTATIRESTKKEVHLDIESTRTFPDPNAPPITVAVALPKGERQRFLVEKLVELGANHLIPLQTARGVAQPTDKALDRITKHIIEATKQCRRAWLMTVDAPRSLQQLAAEYHGFAGERLIADPYSQQPLAAASLEGTIVAVGPEGGFNDDEVLMLEASAWNKATFSPNVLRIETAATAAVAILRSQSQSPA